MVIAQKYITLKNPAVKDVELDLDSPNATFQLNESTLSEDSLKPNQVLTKTIYLSNDPTQRAWIQKGVDPKRLYVPPVFEGETMRSWGLCQVISVGSEVTDLKTGDFAFAVLSWSTYSIVDRSNIYNAIKDTSFPLTMYMDVLGTTGLTAYFGLTEVGHFKEGQSIIISAASGATGSFAVQLAKKVFKARRVIAITGSAEKCDFVKSLGADVALNYKDADFFEKLASTVGDNYVDAYFDLVGGAILDASLKLIKPFGRVIACGAISGYNDSEKYKISNYTEIITNRLTVQGYIVGDFRSQFPEAIGVIATNLKNGNIKTDETTLTVKDATDDFSKVPYFWNMLFTAEKGNGKLLTKIAEPDTFQKL